MPISTARWKKVLSFTGRAYTEMRAGRNCGSLLCAAAAPGGYNAPVDASRRFRHLRNDLRKYRVRRFGARGCVEMERRRGDAPARRAGATGRFVRGGGARARVRHLESEWRGGADGPVHGRVPPRACVI